MLPKAISFFEIGTASMMGCIDCARDRWYGWDILEIFRRDPRQEMVDNTCAAMWSVIVDVQKIAEVAELRVLASNVRPRST